MASGAIGGRLDGAGAAQQRRLVASGVPREPPKRVSGPPDARGGGSQRQPPARVLSAAGGALPGRVRAPRASYAREGAARCRVRWPWCVRQPTSSMSCPEIQRSSARRGSGSSARCARARLAAQSQCQVSPGQSILRKSAVSGGERSTASSRTDASPCAGWVLGDRGSEAGTSGSQ